MMLKEQGDLNRDLDDLDGMGPGGDFDDDGNNSQGSGKRSRTRYGPSGGPWGPGVGSGLGAAVDSPEALRGMPYVRGRAPYCDLAYTSAPPGRDLLAAACAPPTPPHLAGAHTCRVASAAA